MTSSTTDHAAATDVIGSSVTGSSTNTRQSAEALLDASNLCLRHSDAAAVNNISLRMQRGDIVGLLGLNGAGKSTTLRMLCGVLVPNSGSISVNGYDMAERPLLARAHIGFLPDQPPLYNDMRVHEYLTLTGRIRGLKGSVLRERHETVLTQCALTDVTKKIIGTLSKGYRQRVGLAQALIHDPALVLLDEPSNGLDPQQMESMRALIKQIGQTQGIIFSTHLLSEVTATCNRVAIMHEGNLVADRSSLGEDLEATFRAATT